MATPVAKAKRHWRQFSLVTLLAVVTAVAVLLGVVRQRAERQREAVAAIKALGGKVMYAGDNPDEPLPVAVQYLGRWLPRDWIEHVVLVDFYGAEFTDTDLVHLEGLAGVQFLVTGGERVTDQGLVHLHGMSDLRWCSIHSNRVTEAGLADLQAALPDCAIMHMPIGTLERDKSR